MKPIAVLQARGPCAALECYALLFRVWPHVLSWAHINSGHPLSWAVGSPSVLPQCKPGSIPPRQGILLTSGTEQRNWGPGKLNNEGMSTYQGKVEPKTSSSGSSESKPSKPWTFPQCLGVCHRHIPWPESSCLIRGTFVLSDDQLASQQGVNCVGTWT